MKFDPHALLSLLRQCGFEFWRDADSNPICFWVSPYSKLTPEMRDALRRHKPDLLPLIPERKP